MNKSTKHPSDMDEVELRMNFPYYNEREEDGKRVFSMHWNSMEELYNTSAPLEANEHELNARLTVRRPGTSWLGVYSGAALVQKITDGWSELLPKLQDMAASVDLDVQQSASLVNLRKRKRRRGEFGNELDIHRVYQGQCMTAWDKMEHVNKRVQSKRHVALFFHVGGLGDVTFEDSLWRAALAVKLTEMLMASGRMVRIYVGSVAGNAYENAGHHVVTNSVMVKDYSDTLNMSRLAGMATIGFHRVFNFAARCLHPLYRVCSSMGYTAHTNDGLPHHVKNEEVERGALVVCINQCLSESEMHREARRVMEQLRRAEEPA